MKHWKFTATALAGIFLLGLGPAAAFGFHTGGSEECDGCHLTHQTSSSDSSGFSDPTTDSTGSTWMLRGSDPSSTCLRCHTKIIQVLSTDGSAYTPGGDFFWLTRSYTGQGGRSWGDSHGHNVISRDFGLNRDQSLRSAPSDGTVIYQSSWLGCTSCHDPHGVIGESYRLLGGVGYQGGGLAQDIHFTQPAPIARAYPAEGDQLPPETDRNHVDYGTGMSEWCINCHSGFASGSGAHLHPAGREATLGMLARFYNAYVATGKMTGSPESSYDRLVPFERGVKDPALLSPTSTEGPDAQANVMCLSCHRAHASAFSDAGRWDFQATLLTSSAVLSTPEGVHAYYGEDIANRYQPFQRSLCNKCHVQD